MFSIRSPTSLLKVIKLIIFIVMPCYSPIRIKNPSLGSSKVTQKQILNGLSFKTFIDIPCGKCFGCMRMRCESWVFRHLIQLRNSTSALFLTLTYDTQFIPISEKGSFVFNKVHVQNYFKKIRAYLSKNYPNDRILYHLVSEYGDSFGRPHYHVLLYNFPDNTFSRSVLAEKWTYGTLHIGNVTEKSIRYCVDYITQFYFDQEFDTPEAVPFALYSRRPPVGDFEYQNVANYIVANNKKLYPIDGKFYRVPSSYYQKLLTKGYLSYFDDKRLTLAAQSYYYENQQNYKNSLIDDGINPYRAENDLILSKNRQHQRKYALRKSEKY